MKILFAEDQESIREIFVHFIQYHLKSTVLEASCSKTAINILKKNMDIDLIISDYHMPNGNGGKLYEFSKNYCPKVPFVLFSSNISILKHNVAFQNFFLDNQLNTAISKPCKNEEFIFMIKKIINSSLSDLNIDPDRKYQRFNLVLDSEIGDEGFKETSFCKTFNISHGGMFLYLNDSFPPVGKEIYFRHTNSFTVPEKGKGIVRWVRKNPSGNLPSGVGIEFI